MRSAILHFLAVGFLVLVLVASPIAVWVRAEAERHALVDARDNTQRVADNVVGPLITEELLLGDPAALRLLDQSVAPWLDSGNVSRIKVWDESGRVVYSDVGSLIGQEFDPGEWSRLLLEGGPGTATLEHQRSDENEFESGSGELVEVYVRAYAQSGAPMVLETYSSGDAVRREQHAVLMSMIPPMALSLAVLQVAHLVPAVRLARRIQVHQATRTALLRCAIEASDHERRRIAGELHDDVIQDLSGLAYALESEERRGTAELRPVFSNARTTLQRDVRKLRAMTSELYPPDLADLGLRAALLRLGTLLVERGISFTVEIPDDIVLDRDRTVLVHRVAREAVANAAKHSSAQSVGMSVERSGRQTRITVWDDGIGFDTEEPRSDGHFGLRILADTVRQAGGSLHISSAPGRGTSVAATFGDPAPTLRRTGTNTSRPVDPAAGVRVRPVEVPDRPGR